MEKKEKNFKYKKTNTLSEFEMQKLFKESQKGEQHLLGSEKFFGKIKLRKVVSLRNIFGPLDQKESIRSEKSKDISTVLLPRKKLFFDNSKPIYSDNRKNLMPIKTTNFKNATNSNFFRDMDKINKLKNITGFENMKKNIKFNSRKVITNKKYIGGSGFNKNLIVSRSCPDIAAETKYTSDIKNYKTIMIEEQKNQLNNFNTTRFKDKKSALSTMEYSNNTRYNKLFYTKSKYARENILKNFERNTGSIKINDPNYLIYRKKYHFVKNIHVLDVDNHEKLKKEIKQFNKNSLALLLKENDKLFSHIGSIVERSKFSEKFRDPLNNSFEKELKEERKIKEKTLIKLNILPGVDLMKEMDEEIEKRKIVKKVIKGKTLLDKLKRMIIKTIAYIKHLNISLKEILNDYKISKISFAYPQTEYLIMEIRNKNYDACCNILDRHKHIVLDYDYFHLTPLHWAAKINFFEIIPKLMSYGAYINEQNLWGDTPLHYSLAQNNFETTIILLLYLASPFIKNKRKEKPFDYTTDVQLNIIRKKIINIYLKNILGRPKKVYENIQKEFSNYIIFEFSNLLTPTALYLVKDIKSNYL